MQRARRERDVGAERRGDDKPALISKSIACVQKHWISHTDAMTSQMQTLGSYLPPGDGFLPKWLLFVRIRTHTYTLTSRSP